MAARAYQVASALAVIALATAWAGQPSPLAGSSSSTTSSSSTLASMLAHWQPMPGDVVFRASSDLVGDAVRATSGSAGQFSHVGVVVTATGSPMVLDVSPFSTGRAALHTVAAFVDEPTTVRVEVMRPRQAIDVKALNRSAAGIVAHRVPFDYAFDITDSGKLYCSELVYRVLRAAGIGLADVRTRRMNVLLSGTRDVITPDALARSKELVGVLSVGRLETGTAVIIDGGQ